MYCYTCQRISAKKRYDAQRPERLRKAREYYQKHKNVPVRARSTPNEERLAS